MKAKKLIELLKKVDPDKNLVVTNEMGCPAYDYEGEKFRFRFNAKKGRIEMTEEIGS